MCELRRLGLALTEMSAVNIFDTSQVTSFFNCVGKSHASVQDQSKRQRYSTKARIPMHVITFKQGQQSRCDPYPYPKQCKRSARKQPRRDREYFQLSSQISKANARVTLPGTNIPSSIHVPQENISENPKFCIEIIILPRKVI
jgi:hypothetical protein